MLQYLPLIMWSNASLDLSRKFNQGSACGFKIRFYLILLISGQSCKKFHQFFFVTKPNIYCKYCVSILRPRRRVILCLGPCLVANFFGILSM